MLRMGIAPCSPFSVTAECMTEGGRGCCSAMWRCPHASSPLSHLHSHPSFIHPPTHASAAKLARQFPAVRLHTHLAENEQDIEFSLKTYGCRPGGYLQ